MRIGTFKESYVADAALFDSRTQRAWLMVAAAALVLLPFVANDYWLYVVFHCATPTPNINILRNPATLEWQPVVKVEHYKLNVSSIRSPVELNQDRAEYKADKN